MPDRDDDLNDQMRSLCQEKGWRFRPREVHPADADEGPPPWPPGSAGGISWPKARSLRRKLIAEIEGR